LFVWEHNLVPSLSRPAVQLLRRPVKLVGLALVFLAAGCGARTAVVQGKVTFRDEALASGSVAFTDEDKGQVGFAIIGPDGFYRVPNAPVGQGIKVTVNTPPPPTQAAAPAAKGSTPAKGGRTGAAAPPKKRVRYVKVPKIYSNPTTTPMTYDVRPGNQRFDIPLR
jgi:hypothetical protein